MLEYRVNIDIISEPAISFNLYTGSNQNELEVRMTENQDTISIPLTQGKFAFIDASDYELVSRYKWSLKLGYNGHKNYYAMTASSKRTTHRLMHRLIMDAPKNLQVDHINGNGLDNRRCNLRICTHSENLYNQKLRYDNQSGYKGVCWHKRANKWRVQIRYNKEKLYFGVYTNPLDAALVYDAKAIKLFGKYAKTNKMLGLLPIDKGETGL